MILIQKKTPTRADSLGCRIASYIRTMSIFSVVEEFHSGADPKVVEGR
jgi:hypothetical protein